MTKELFPHYAGLVSKAIAKANTAEEQFAAVILIEHLENDYSLMYLPGKDERIQELRDQLQVKHEELKSDNVEHTVMTQCGEIRFNSHLDAKEFIDKLAKKI